VVGPHVAIDVEEAEEVTALSNAQTRQLRTQLLGLVIVLLGHKKISLRVSICEKYSEPVI